MPAFCARQGCDGCEFFADYEAGDYGIVVLWASKQDAEAAASGISPILTPLLADAKKTAESRGLFDILRADARVDSYSVCCWARIDEVASAHATCSQKSEDISRQLKRRCV